MAPKAAKYHLIARCRAAVDAPPPDHVCAQDKYCIPSCPYGTYLKSPYYAEVTLVCGRRIIWTVCSSLGVCHHRLTSNTRYDTATARLRLVSNGLRELDDALRTHLWTLIGHPCTKDQSRAQQ